MRVGLLVVVCGLAACDVKNGTYFIVDGADAGIEFDQVEFFLGKDHGGGELYTPTRAYDPSLFASPDQRLRLRKRMYAPSDDVRTSSGTSLTYYLPPDPENLFPHYALVVASRGGSAVGLGEIESFNVFDDGAYIYDVPLVPVPADNSFERWGTEPDAPEKACVRWTRVRGDDNRETTFAVVREHDRDCDGAAASEECDDRNYCADPVAGNSPCQRREILCIGATACDLGTCLDGQASAGETKSCFAQTCLPDVFCRAGDECKEDGNAEEFLECAIEIGMTHTEVPMPVKTAPDGPLCTNSYIVYPPDGLRCLNPAVQWPRFGVVGDWEFHVSPSNDMVDACEFILKGPSVDATPPAKTHLVVSVDTSDSIGKQTSFVIGFLANTTAGCATVALPPPPPLMGEPNPTCP